MTPPLVEIDRVSKKFGDLVVAQDVSLTIQRGEFLTLLGPSGCGKTTMLRMVAGFDTPTSGAVRIEGVDQAGKPPYERRVNTVFQHYALFPHLTVAENVAFGLSIAKRPRDEIQKKVAAALEQVRLAGHEKKRPGQLSGGQKQRVALARALVLEPQVLLLDEPLGALDFKLRKEMQVELKGLQRRLSLTFVLVTHDQEEALVLSDRIAVMNKGQIEQLDTAVEIYERPKTHFVADFLGFTNFIPGVLEGHRDDEVRVRGPEGLFTVSVPESFDRTAGRHVLVAVRPEKVQVSRRLPAGSANLTGGTVDEVIYLGTGVKLLVKLAQGALVTAVVPTPLPEGVAGVARGDAVDVAFSPAQAVVLADPGAKR
jgi:spermidine/putrescine ABC transporter ATP-binding subunit